MIVSCKTAMSLQTGITIGVQVRNKDDAGHYG